MPSRDWDIFLAHADSDKPAAERLYDLLDGHCRALVDWRCAGLGEDWAAVPPGAQRTSRITVVLVTKNTDSSYYQREEIATAIGMARGKDRRRVVPLFLHPAKSKDVPYGLRLKNGLSARG